MQRNRLFTSIMCGGALASAAFLPGAWAGGGSDWVEAGTGSWATAGNWSPAAVPDGTDATIDNGGTAQVVGIAPPTFDLLTVGSGNAGSIEISGGGTLDSSLFGIFGETPGSSGTLSISGIGSSLTLFRELRLGLAGAATILIENGGTLTSNTSGAVIDTILAERPGSIASVTIQDAGSSWQTNDGLRIAMPATGAGGTSGGTAELTVTAGGTLSSNGGTLSRGAAADATVTVTGPGSQWNTNGYDISVGSGSDDNRAVVIVEAGGRISGDEIIINQPSTQAGTRTVRLGTGGAPGVLDIDRVFGGGVFEINHDAPDYHLTTDGTATGAPVLLEAGLTVNHNGPGTTFTSGDSEASGTFNVNAGTFVVDGTFFPGQFSFDAVFNVNAGGRLGGNGFVTDVFVAAGGILAPGRSAGTLSTDDLTLADGAILEFELAAPGTVGGGVNDLLEVGRDLTLDGTLNITGNAGFDAGIYRLVNYSRILVDNGLEIGTAPAGFSYAIDTAREGEVNLVVSDDSGDISGLLLPEQLSFDNVEAGQTGIPEPLLVTGTGADPLQVVQVDLVGIDAGAFQLTEDTCTGQLLNQNASCDLAVTFAPGTPGLKFARIEVETNAAEDPLVTPMSGIAVTADSIFADSFE